MHPYESILAYASSDDEAFLAVDQAAELARASGASLTVVRVLEYGSWLNPWKPLGGDPEEVRGFLERSHRELLEGHIGGLRDSGLDIRVRIHWGTPWLELIRCVLRDGHDLVVKAAEGATRSRGLFFGSTALHLFRKCPCPVWIVGGTAAGQPRRVLAALDPAPDETRTAIGQRILDLAVSIAGERGEVHAASAWRAEGENLLRTRMRPNEFADLLRATKEDALAGLERALELAGDPVEPDQIHLLKGDARDVLPQLVDHEGFDLMVMGSAGRVGVAGFLIGETAESVIRSVRCSVIVVKPPGFECPVGLTPTEQEVIR